MRRPLLEWQFAPLRSSRSSGLLAIGLLVTCCRYGSREESAKDHRAGARSAPVALPGVREQMLRMQATLQDLRRRAAGGVAMRLPATQLAAEVRAAARPGFPPAYRARSEAFARALEKLAESRKRETRKRDFNEMVSRCLACHEAFAPRSASQVRRLLLP